jgi:hypothetical protein
MAVSLSIIQIKKSIYTPVIQLSFPYLATTHPGCLNIIGTMYLVFYNFHRIYWKPDINLSRLLYSLRVEILRLVPGQGKARFKQFNLAAFVISGKNTQLQTIISVYNAIESTKQIKFNVAVLRYPHNVDQLKTCAVLC